MLESHAVGIDLGTTYSCIAYLNQHGEPVTLPNAQGELSTPSVVLFDGDEVIVGTEALRHAVANPTQVVQNSKRHIGDPGHRYGVKGKTYTPVDIGAFILKELLSSASERLGQIERAVITVPAQFSEIQRQATVEVGLRAGLKQVDIINEPVAAALCYVLGTEGLWFAELADEQKILVYDLGGGTFDLSLVKYQKNEVSVIASSGDLNLGGVDYNHELKTAICALFAKKFKQNPHSDPESLQFLALEVEDAKRSLSVRSRAAITCRCGANRSTYRVEKKQFEKMTSHLTERTCELTRQLLEDNGLGWAHIDVILTTGGASRMPMIRNALKTLGGRTLNTSLSPDQSIAHGATYYAGMLLTNSEYAKSILNDEANARLARMRQRPVNARSLGILVRIGSEKRRVPYDLIAPNTPLPTSVTHPFGTVIPNQQRVHLHIVEGGTATEESFVELGTCVIDELPPHLPEGSAISVTISYDDQARVHVSARDVTSGNEASTEIVRQENLKTEIAENADSAAETGWNSSTILQPDFTGGNLSESQKRNLERGEISTSRHSSRDAASGMLRQLEESSQPVPLCSRCFEPLDHHGACRRCETTAAKEAAPASLRSGKLKRRRVGTKKKSSKTGFQKTTRKREQATVVPMPVHDEEILELDDSKIRGKSKKKVVREKNKKEFD